MLYHSEIEPIQRERKTKTNNPIYNTDIVAEVYLARSDWVHTCIVIILN